MVCSNCGDGKHNIVTCPKLRDVSIDEMMESQTGEADHSTSSQGDTKRRGLRESPRTPVTDAEKVAKLRSMSYKMSPNACVPPMPGHDVGEILSAVEGGPAQTASAGAPPKTQDPGAAGAADGSDTEGLKSMMNNMMAMMKNLSTDMQSVSSRIDESNNKAQKAVDIAEKTETKVKEMQESAITKKDVQDMIDQSISDEIDKKLRVFNQQPQAPTPGVTTPSSLIVGGLEGSSFEAAAIWVKGILEKMKSPTPIETYTKGDAFKGLLWLRFGTAGGAKEALTAMKDTISKNPSNKAWCNYDLPIEQRVSNSFLFGLKAQLVAWKLPKKYLNIDPDRNVMQVRTGGKDKDIVRAWVDNDTFQIKWLAEEWAEWTELQQSPELTAMTSKAHEKLSSSRAQTSKGVGKGPQ